MGDARPETRGYNQLSRPISDSNSPCDDDDNTPTEPGCMGRCCRCLAAVPCSALMCCLMTMLAISACGGSLMVASRRTTDLLEYKQDLFEHTDAVCLGVIFGMAFLVFLLLIGATFTSRPLNVDFLASSRKTKCVLAWLVMEMLLLLLFLLAWMGLMVILSYPLVVFFIVYIRYYNGDDCIDLRQYLIPHVDAPYCGVRLHDFYQKSILTFEVYTIALVGAALVVLSLVFHLMHTAANYVQIRESAPSNYDLYKNEVANKHPGGSVLDTRM